MMSLSLLTASMILAAGNQATFLGMIAIPGEAKDLSKPKVSGVNTDRLGGFGSDFWYEPESGNMFGIVDRGPGGGTIAYEARAQRFKAIFDKSSGKLTSFKLQETLKLTDGSQFMDGLNPLRKTGKPDKQGLSFDAEGIVRGPRGTFFISEEYGPAISEFMVTQRGKDRVLKRLRTFVNPEKLTPRDVNGKVNFLSPIAGQPELGSGRQDNRGFEGLAITPDGRFLFALLQGPLQEEGNPDGRHSNYLRLIRFEISSGRSDREFLYPMEKIEDINQRITTDLFTPKQQGRTIGISAILALNHREFLVLERENRGIGVDDPLAKKPIASKRIFKINVTEATNVSAISLKGTNDLPADVVPVQKTLWLDLQAELIKAKLPIGEKIEALAIGPKLGGKEYAFIIGTDNDFSVTQNEDGKQFDVVFGGGKTQQVALDQRVKGQALIPSYLYSFRVNLPEYVAPFWFKETE
jgi:hypothetical protein